MSQHQKRSRGSKKDPRNAGAKPKSGGAMLPPAGREGTEARVAEEQLQGPPPHEATLIRTDAERRAEREAAEHPATSDKLTGGDVDADWQRAHLSGEEAVGGHVATPDQDVVDDLGDALGVSREPAEEFRTSTEILEKRDARRGRGDE
jgi:hypothetical protein